MKQFYIYMTTNNINNMKYIGKHYGELDDTYLGSGTILKQAIKKYGKENFTKTVLFISNNEEENNKKEKEFIALYNATTNPLFYNIHEGGNGGNTQKGFTQEQKENFRKKMSEITRGQNNGMYGKKHSENTKEFLSFWALFLRDNSVYRTDDFRKKMSENTSGSKNGMYGKTHSEISKKKMSDSSIGKTSGIKNGMYGKSGENAINGKSLEMYDKDWNLIKIFNTKKLAMEFLGIKGHSALDKAIKNKTLYKNYYWKNHD